MNQPEPAPSKGHSAPGHTQALQGRLRLAAEILALVYIGVIAAIASATGAFYILFPELGALSYSVIGRPRGRWAGAPFLLAVTPALTGVIGTIVTRTMPYDFVSVLITVGGALAVIRILRSPIAPAISAGLLPLVLGVRSWWYPPGILFGSVLLVLISLPWKRYALGASATAPAESPGSGDGEAATQRSDTPWLGALLVFVGVAVAVVKITGLRFVLFPPLVVIIYEMFRDPVECPWAGRTVRLPVVCFLSAAGGFLLYAAVPFAPLAAMLSMAWGIGVLRLLRLHVPPALAVALLPMVMDHPRLVYPVAVGIGTALAAAWFAAFELWVERRRVVTPA